MRIQILYFSGAGATKRVAGQIAAELERMYDVALRSFENMEGAELEQCDALVIGTPVYHAAPARLVMDYFDSIPPLDSAKPAFLYNTRGLYSCNTNRILAKKLSEKNILTVMDRSYRAPASDGSLIAPFIKRFFNFDPGIREKVQGDCKSFLRLLSGPEDCRAYIPRFRLSGILNAPNKWGGELITFPIYLHKERCCRCGKCAANCPYGALAIQPDGFPHIHRRECGNCYRCIHHCPQMALSLSKSRGIQKVLYK